MKAKERSKMTDLKMKALVLFVMFNIGGLSYLMTSAWLNAHIIYFQSPIVIQSKQVIEPKPTSKPVVTPSPLPTKRPNLNDKTKSSGLIPAVYADEPEKVELLHQEIFDKVWMLESTQGRATTGFHLYCRAKGMWNEIGYNPQGKFCFDNEEQARGVFGRWFQKKFDAGYTTDEALCMWNIGKKVESCTYSINYHSL